MSSKPGKWSLPIQEEPVNYLLAQKVLNTKITIKEASQWLNNLPANLTSAFRGIKRLRPVVKQ